MPKATARSKCITALQLLRRLEEADDNGYCTCVTCGVVAQWNEGIQGGHFIDKSHSSYWALQEENVNPQCSGCNGFGMKHGTARYSYMKWMEAKHGELFVQNMMETKKDIRKMYAADYREMLADFNARIRVEKKRIGAK